MSLRRWLTGFACAVLASIASPEFARAHSGGASYVDFSQRDGEWHAQLDLPLADVAEEFQFDLDSDGALRWGAVLDAAATLQAAYAERLSIKHKGSTCHAIADAPVELVRRSTGTHLRIRQRYGTQQGCGGEIAVDVGRWIAALPEHGVYVTRSGAGHDVTLLAGTANTVRIEAAVSSANAVSTGTRYLVLGIEHLLTGYDHLAFLLLLLLAIARPRVGQSVTVRAALIEATKVVTAFTVAHSLTLVLAATGLISFSSTAVEAAIAASIVVTAIAVIFGIRVAAGWRVAFLFGLIHGLGFANLLAELLTGVSLALPLISFNLGLELAQIAVALLALPLCIWLARRPAIAARAVPVVAVSCGALGAYWLVERL